MRRALRKSNHNSRIAEDCKSMIITRINKLTDAKLGFHIIAATGTYVPLFSAPEFCQ